MKIITLGNCATQSLNEATTSFLLEHANKMVLIDCGPSIVHQLIKYKADLAILDTIIVTHCHADHTAGLPYLFFTINLMRTMKKEQKYNKVKLIGLKSVVDGVMQTLQIQYPIEKIENIIEVIYIKDLDTLECTPFKFNFMETYHTVPSIAVRINIDGKTVSFSSDTLYNEKFIEFFKDSDVLYYEGFCSEQNKLIAKQSGHSTAKEAGIIAKLANVKKLYLTHPLAFELFNTQNLINDAKSIFDKEVIIPTELTEVEI